MTNTGLKSSVKKWTDKNLIDPKFKFGFKTPMEMVCPKAEVINPEAEKTANGTNTPSKRWSTEYWLRELIEEWDFRFEDFISISSIIQTKTLLINTLITSTLETLFLISSISPIDPRIRSDYGSL